MFSCFIYCIIMPLDIQSSTMHGNWDWKVSEFMPRNGRTYWWLRFCHSRASQYRACWFQGEININQIILIESLHLLDLLYLVVGAGLENSDTLQGNMDSPIRTPVDISKAFTSNVLHDKFHSSDKQLGWNLVTSLWVSVAVDEPYDNDSRHHQMTFYAQSGI